MWIGVIIVVVGTGSTAADAALFPDEAACRAQQGKLTAAIEISDQPVAYSVQCYEAAAFLKIHNGRPA